MTRERVLLGLYAVAWVLVIAYVVFGLPWQSTVKPERSGPTHPRLLTHAEASDAGFRAGLDGHHQNACPFPAGTTLRLAWLEGWIDGTERRQQRQQLQPKEGEHAP